MPQAHSTRSRLGLLTRRTGFRAHLPVHCRLFVMVPFLFLLIMVQVETRRRSRPEMSSRQPSNHPPIVVNPGRTEAAKKPGTRTGSGSGPVQYCSACRIPLQGVFSYKERPGPALCKQESPLHMRVFSPVKSDQEMCLYVLMLLPFRSCADQFPALSQAGLKYTAVVEVVLSRQEVAPAATTSLTLLPGPNFRSGFA